MLEQPVFMTVGDAHAVALGIPIIWPPSLVPTHQHHHHKHACGYTFILCDDITAEGHTTRHKTTLVTCLKHCKRP